MKFKNLNEGYDLSDVDLTQLGNVISIVSKCRNDLLYLHVNSWGLSFKTSHEMLDKYYKQANEDLDYILELVGMYSTGEIINLNSSRMEGISNAYLRTEKSIFEGMRTVISNILQALEMLRACIFNDALISKIDDIASFWVKEKSYILKQVLK